MNIQLSLHTAFPAYSQNVWDIAAHSHRYHELVLVVSGRITSRHDDGLLHGSPGTLHTFPGGQRHDQRSEGPWRTLCVHYLGDEPWIRSGVRAVDTHGDSLVAAWFAQLAQLCASTTPERLTATALLSALLLRLRRLESRHREDSDLHPALAQATQFMRAHCAQELDVAALARICNLSPSHLGALCRARYGCAPLRWHQRVRLERAQALLANPYTSVDAVAAELGFASTGYFIRCFRLTLGSTPGQWLSAAKTGKQPPARKSDTGDLFFFVTSATEAVSLAHPLP